MILYISAKFSEKPEINKLVAAAYLNGIQVNKVLNTWNKKDIGFHRDFALYGEHSFCEFIAQEVGLKLHSNSLDWITHLPLELTRRRLFMLKLHELKSMDIKSVEKTGISSISNNKWLEPANESSFTPGIYGFLPKVNDDTNILVSDDISWDVKYRFVIVDGKIATSCCYRFGQVFNNPSNYKNNYTAEAITPDSFVQTILDHFNTAPSCIIDVGHTHKGWGVIGTYPVWASEMYGCDPNEFLRALFDSCESS